MNKKIITLLMCAALTGTLLFTSCATTQNIPTTLTKQELIQAGQSAMDSGSYRKAETYFKTTIKRYGVDTASYIEASYELGHLYYKEKRYADALPIFDEIIAQYVNAQTGSLPPAFLKLAQLDKDKIIDATSKKTK